MTTPWDAVALEKLTRVVGAPTAGELRSRVLAELGVASLADANDLYRFAQLLVRVGGFAGAVGGLLSVHAVMHGATERNAEATGPE